MSVDSGPHVFKQIQGVGWDRTPLRASRNLFPPSVFLGGPGHCGSHTCCCVQGGQAAGGSQRGLALVFGSVWGHIWRCWGLPLDSALKGNSRPCSADPVG